MPVRETRQVPGLRQLLGGSLPPAERSAVCMICSVRARTLVASLIPQPRRPAAPVAAQWQPLPG